MKLPICIATAVTFLAFAAPAAAGSPAPGDYICTVTAKAGIGSIHLEGAPAPGAFTEAEITRFAIRISPRPEGKVEVAEAPYDGPDRNRYEWHTPNAVLHAVYVGDGEQFTALEDQAFLRFGYVRANGAFSFYHSGFEYPGGEDTNLSVRYGTCAPAD